MVNLTEKHSLSFIITFLEKKKWKEKGLEIGEGDRGNIDMSGEVNKKCW